MTCDHCHDAPPRFVAVDLPEQEGGLMFGDQVAGVLLCAPCLEASEANGPWDAVEDLENDPTNEAAGGRPNAPGPASPRED